LYQAKARYLKELSAQLIHHFDSKVPSTREELMTLSGVGRKTANVVLNTLYGDEVIAVDTHVLRVSQRLGLSLRSTPLGVEEDLMLCIPKDMLKDAHHHLILHGRYTCKARRPLCGQCPLQALCNYPL
jgi:endonuclease-3